ncbi:unnamed protein product [Ceratitis capitata]|uniref:(Mediterranean fruit fly) hypothetical protein n=1 Tax=Ceratitis capitata TaxID=7213 RepID=A0A811VJA5_CERCA|nr:unnamed protein product [Ceratitis capitata]
MLKKLYAVKQTGQRLVRLRQLCGARFQAQAEQQRNSSFSNATQQQLKELIDENAPERTDAEWSNAKEYDALPAQLDMDFFLASCLAMLRQKYGDIFLLKGAFGRVDTVFTYNADDFEVVYRNEGIWPIRAAMMSFDYYRKVKRVDFFKGQSGLVTEHGSAWGDMRNKVNPVMMKSASIRQDLPEIDKITMKFVDR